MMFLQQPQSLTKLVEQLPEISLSIPSMVEASAMTVRITFLSTTPLIMTGFTADLVSMTTRPTVEVTRSPNMARPELLDHLTCSSQARLRGIFLGMKEGLQQLMHHSRALLEEKLVEFNCCRGGSWTMEVERLSTIKQFL